MSGDGSPDSSGDWSERCNIWDGICINIGVTNSTNHETEEETEEIADYGGRDEDKVAGAGLTVEFTELGNPIYAEADLAIECKKLYGQQFDANLMTAEQREWYEKTGLGVHYMYIGEIVHVWKN